MDGDGLTERDGVEVGGGFEVGLGVVVFFGVGVVGLIEVGEADFLEPFDGFEAVRPGDDHADGAAAFEGEGFAIELVGEEDGQLAGRCLHDLGVAEGGLEALFKVVIVEAPKVDAADV